MRIEHLTSHLNFNSSPHMPSNREKVKQGLDHGSENLGASINNNRPAKSVNFGGSASLNTQKIIQGALNDLIQDGAKDFKGIKKAPNWAVGFLNSAWVVDKLKLVKDNEAKFENIITIFLAGLLKPICVLAMPGAEKEDKQVAATKNFVAAVTGFVLSTSVLTPVSKAVKKVTKDSASFVKYLGESQKDYIKLINPEFEDTVVGIAKDGKKIMGGSLSDAYSTFYKKVADLAITPTKAAITIAFMPHLLKLLFGDKNKKNKEAKPEVQNIQNAPETAQVENSIHKIQLSEKEQVFKQFSGGLLK